MSMWRAEKKNLGLDRKTVEKISAHMKRIPLAAARQTKT
jgi:hypothetical protein